MGKRVKAVKPELERYAGLVNQIKAKLKERKNLLAEKKETPFYQIPKRMTLPPYTEADRRNRGTENRKGLSASFFGLR